MNRHTQMHRTATTRTAKVLAVVAAGAALGLGGALAVAATNGPATNDPAGGRTPSPALVDYARDHGLTGLSPASLSRATSSTRADIDAIEDYARANDLTGLSPASMQPTTTQP